MLDNSLSIYCGLETISIVDAMCRIDANAKGILFIVDVFGKLKGTLTDGDIRRWIMNAGELSKPVKEAMNNSPKYIKVNDELDSVEYLKNHSITAVPIVEDDLSIIRIVFSSESNIINKNRQKLTDVPVVIMAGGKGTRLYPYTRILPKPLIPIGDTPIVERIINYYMEYGINKFYMTVNYKKAMIKSYFDELKSDYVISYVEENKPLGTGGSIKLIEEKFESPLFVTNCDALILADYADIYSYHIKSGNDITMISALKNIQIPYGVLHTGENGMLKSIEEKPKFSYFINTGMYIINPDLIELIPDDEMFHMPQLVEMVMQRGGAVGTYPVSEDSFLDMGELDEMKRMEEKLHIVQ